jgi:hypothetical protein
MSTRPVERPPTEAVLCDDVFTDPRERGEVIGSTGPNGAQRLGVDVEGRISIDHDALRIAPLEQPGWGREGIAYGPFTSQPGLGFAAHVLNGHHSSQTFYFPESFRARVKRWLTDARRGRFRRMQHHENLAVGFVADPATSDPVERSHAFVMHAATEENGELWSTDRGRRVRLARGVQNLPFVFAVVLRADGTAAYYTSSLPGSLGAAGYPMFRPLGVSGAATGTNPWYATIQQRILGEVGYDVDSRVYRARVAVVEEWSEWWGSAHLADPLTGTGPVAGSTAAVGGSWVSTGATGPDRTEVGARSPGGEPVGARLSSPTAVGLLRAEVSGGHSGRAELFWSSSSGSGWIVRTDHRGCSIVQVDDTGAETILVEDPERGLRAGAPHVVQVVIDGDRTAVHVDRELVGERWWPLATAGGGEVGFGVSGDLALRALEAHPAEIPIPTVLDVGAPWQPPASRPVIDERFDVVADELDGTTTPSGGRRWERTCGPGGIVLLGEGRARVNATRENPNPDRTIFTVPWDDPSYADIEIEMTPPGEAIGEGEAGRVGMVFWQDPDNYLVANVFVDDSFDGASISTFYHLGGYENMYDAVWTLVPGVRWGQRCSLRTAFDGHRFLSWANDEPSLVRALTDVYPSTPPLRIERIGIVVNEEWGNDTGSVIHRFTAGCRAEPNPGS